MMFRLGKQSYELDLDIYNADFFCVDSYFYLYSSNSSVIIYFFSAFFFYSNWSNMLVGISYKMTGAAIERDLFLENLGGASAMG